MRNLLLSTAIGDISGKPYESRRTRTKDYDSVDLLLPENTYSDDTVCTFACADALLNHKDFVDCLKLAISLGGDSDTLAAISAPIACAYYRVIPEALLDNARKKLPKWMLELSESFDDFIIREIGSY